MQVKFNKTVSRTYSFKDGGFYKCQFEYEEIYDGKEINEINIEENWKSIGSMLDRQLKEEKEKLGL